MSRAGTLQERASCGAGLPGAGQPSEMNDPATATPGIDPERLTPWLLANVAGLAAPLRYTFIEGGRSNLTYRIDDDAGRSVVLRRPPLGSVLRTAHDMSREHRLISAVGPALTT